MITQRLRRTKLFLSIECYITVNILSLFSNCNGLVSISFEIYICIYIPSTHTSITWSILFTNCVERMSSAIDIPILKPIKNKLARTRTRVRKRNVIEPIKIIQPVIDMKTGLGLGITFLMMQHNLSWIQAEVQWYKLSDMQRHRLNSWANKHLILFHST
jgi:hypothetical protein